jgi:hypothetical protein
MTALKTMPKPKATHSRATRPILYELSIYSYQEEDLPSRIEPIIENFGLKVVGRTVRSFYMPHDGTDLYTTELRVKAPRHDTHIALAKARSWLEAAEAMYGWDIRFEPCTFHSALVN